MLTRPSVSIELQPTLRLANVHFPIEVRRSSRANRFSLKVSQTERAAILTLPDRGRIEDASAFLARHADWLRKQIDRLPEPIPFANGAVIPVRGSFHHLNFAGLQKDKGVVWSEPLQSAPLPVTRADAAATAFAFADWQNLDNRLHEGCDLPKLLVSGNCEHGARRLSDWLRTEAKKDISACVARHAKTLNCSPKRISIRDQATRWGSCSSSGTLSFSWRLIFAPPFVLDYVAAHEVAHLREMNHGPRFWRLVRDAFPAMQKARMWLKTYGADLHRFGVEA